MTDRDQNTNIRSNLGVFVVHDAASSLLANEQTNNCSKAWEGSICLN